MRYKFNIKNYPNEPDNIDLWLDVKDKIEIDGKLYFMRTITKYQQFESTIQDVIAYCNIAIALNKKVLWING
ncbi:hypothetical protein D770_23400 [Flammeovirgaceae bacterium 311]|nr:hypothetical protein D770_23370 [Flammeovirgaceae bacterium 311]AHM62925.1 hypothetical protein D770_23400 [Flammeovirgaceae bacterium 311]